MATEKEASLNSCASDPNFAVICSFLNQFAASCGIAHPTFSELQEMLEDTTEVSQVLVDIHIKLLRKARKSFTADKWEKALAKFCHTYSQQDGWELERFGYKKARLSVKVKLLKVLLETQFDVNGKFKSEVNKVGAKELRLEPLGRDQSGFQYWCQFDKSSHVRIYREDVDDETWELVASDRNGLVQLIDSLSNGEGQLELNSILNEDSTSQEIEKPITDTGQGEEKQEEATNDEEDGDDEEEDEEEEEGGEELEEEEEEDEEEVEEEEEVDDEDESKETIDVVKKPVEEKREQKQAVEERREQKQAVEEKREQKPEPVQVKSVEAVSNHEQEKPIALTNGSNAMPHPGLIRPVEENMSSLTGVDLSIKSDPKKYLPTSNDYYPPVPDRPYIPERNDILSQMSARFNDPREAEDLSFNPAKKLRLDKDDDQPMMLVKKDIVVSEAIEEPVRLVTGPGSGEDCQQGNPLFSRDCELENAQLSEDYQLGNPQPSKDCELLNPQLSENCQFGNSQPNKDCELINPQFSKYCQLRNPLLSRDSELGNSLLSGDCELVNPQPSGDCQLRNPLHSEDFELGNSLLSEDCQLVNPQPSRDCQLGNPLLSADLEEVAQYLLELELGIGLECGAVNPNYIGSLGLSESDDKKSSIEEEPDYSDVIEERSQYVVGLGPGNECDVANPKSNRRLDLNDSDDKESAVEEGPEFSEVIEEPVQYVVGLGLGRECDAANPMDLGSSDLGDSDKQSAVEEEPEFSEVIEEPIQYVVGLGSGNECDVANPKYNGRLHLNDSDDKESVVEAEPEFSRVIEEPVQYIAGLGSGKECEIGNPQKCSEGETSNSSSMSTIEIECSFESLSLITCEPKFSEVIEEPVMFVHGSGYGEDCLTGNPDEGEESIEEKSPEKKPKLWSIDAICSSQKLLTESLNQKIFESFLKDPACEASSSTTPDGNGTLNCTKRSIANDENISACNLSNSVNSSLKPFSGVKPILENIPMKDKPPDNIETASASSVPEVINDISSSRSNESSSNCMSNVHEESDTNQELISESIPSSVKAQTSSDVSSGNCTSEENLPVGEELQITNCTVKASTTAPVSDSKTSSGDNSRTSIIPGESVEDKESSSIAGGVLASHTAPNVFIIKEHEKSAERNPIELPGTSSKLDKNSCPDVNSTKANSKKCKASSFDKNVADSVSSISTDSEIKKPLVEKCDNNDKLSSLLDKNNLTNCENGSKVSGISNCTVVCEKISDLPLSSGKKSKLKSSMTISSSTEPEKSISDKSNLSESINPSASDKNEEKRKNVMLTNIIEVCLDNDNYSKDSVKSGLKGQMNAKFNDLFSAKNLLEPLTKMSSKETCNDSNDFPIAYSSENCTGGDCSDEKAETCEEVKINADVNVKDEKTDDIKKEDNINAEETVQSSSMSKLVTENKIKSENCDFVKSDEIKEENPIRNTTRGRKSRTNSVNNDEETEIPIKIRKTDIVPASKPRRVSRRNTSSTSQNDVCLESEDDKAVIKETITKSKNNSAIIKDPINAETDLKEEKTENKIEQKNENDKGVEEVMKKEEKEDETDESTKKEVEGIDCKTDQDKEDSEKSSTQESKGFTLASFSLEQPLEDGPVLGKPPDFKSQASRKRRNSRKLSRSEEDGGEVDDDDKDGDEAGGKRPRLRAKTRRSKATPPSTKHVQPNESSSDDNQAEDTIIANSKDKRRARGRPMKKKDKSDAPAPSKSKQRKAKEIEKNTEKGSGSNEESEIEKEEAKPVPTKKESRKKQQSTKEESEKEDSKKNKSKLRGRPKKEAQSSKEEKDDESDNEDEEVKKESIKTEVDEIKAEEEIDSKPVEDEQPQPKKKGRPKKQKNLLGLLECDLIHSKPSPNETEGSRVRQSRRIAQIKIKEEAERRAIEEATMMLTMKEVKKKSPKEESKQSLKKQKKKKGKTEKVSEEEDETFKEPSEERKKGRKKKKKKGLTYDINKPWQSSSDDSSEEAEEEEEHFEEEDDEEDIRASKVVSDHEFSPESDLEKDDTVEPIRRARTAKKDEDEVKDEEAAEATEDYPCKKCGQPDHPEWILLCDKCDSGYHASCLRPTLMLIPEGDWFCPPCQHLELVSKLKETLRAFEKNTKRRENEELRKKRLAYVGISLANVLPTQEKSQSYSGGRRIISESSESSSEESESSDDEEPVYQLRQRRAALQANYRFNDYDELINSAIQDEMEAVKGAGNMGRGKDIANIVEAEKKAALTDETGAAVEEEPKVDEEEEQGENWRPPVVPKNTSLPSLRKKPKKLTDLDKQSEDDADSDEDFKGSSEEEEFSSTEGGDSDDSLGRRQPVRRSSRARISRIDKEFINDDSESSDEPRKKKTRRIWASSSSESSDTTWGRRKRKSKTYNRIRTSKSSRKKKKMVLDSDSDRPKKPKTKRPKIRYGLSEDEGEPLRRTRGKKMSYLEVAGSDTEEEVIARSRKMIRSDDEEEFVPEKEVGDDENEPDEIEPVEEIEEEEVEDEEEEVEEEEEDEEDEDEEKGKEKNKANPEAEEKVSSDAKEKKEGEVKEELKKLPEKAVKVPVPEIQNKEPIIEPEPEKPTDDDEDDDQVEEEEIEEEVEEEVEEEEEEEEDDDSQIEEVKNLVREKVEEPKGIIQSPIKVGTGVSIIKVPVAPALGSANSNPTAPQPATPTATAIPTPVIKEEKKEEKKEPTPAIRLVPSAKLLDPNKRRPPEESVIRGMLGGGGYYRPPPLQPPGRQPFRQRFSEQQRYLFQAPPASHHQFYPGGAFYAGEDYVVGSGYEEQMDPNVPGGDEEGVFSGLVSYFSSQREDNLDS